MLAYDFPVLGFFWSVLMFGLAVAWLLLVFRVIFDIFRSPLSGLAKGLWSLLVIITPFIGVFCYLLAHGSSMAERHQQSVQQEQEAFSTYLQAIAGSGSAADELSRLVELHKSGVLTDAEFREQKAKVLAS